MGSDWIHQGNPVTLEMSRPGDATVPSGLTRRRVLEQMAAKASQDKKWLLLEGVFLTRGCRYIALIGQGDAAMVVGLGKTPLVVGFPAASSWRRLAWGVGEWLTESDRGNSVV